MQRTGSCSSSGHQQALKLSKAAAVGGTAAAAGGTEAAAGGAAAAAGGTAAADVFECCMG